MNREEWKELTPDEQRIHIAKLCEWTIIKDSVRTHYLRPQETIVQYLQVRNISFIEDLPDYLNDLNAMYKAEQNSYIFKSWREKKCWMKNMHICCDLGRQPESEPDRIHALIATASQRAEAFVMTLDVN